MKNRKFVALLCAALLSLSIAATATAATVPSAVYGPVSGKGEKAPVAQTQSALATYGVKDILPNDWAAGSAVVLLQAGLVAPDANGNLNINAHVSYTTTASIFAKVLGIASKTDDEATAAAKLTNAGIAGAPDKDGNVSRLQFAKMIAAALGVQPAAANTLAFKDTLGISAADNALLLALKQAGIFIGFEDGTFRADEPLTMAQVAVLMDRILSAN